MKRLNEFNNRMSQYVPQAVIEWLCANVLWTHHADMIATHIKGV